MIGGLDRPATAGADEARARRLPNSLSEKGFAKLLFKMRQCSANFVRHTRP
jgi:hypothetical protein